ncbi:uncharacterized protein C8A04DRAFT_9095 [Dichotomopilus funicola]|uniref:Uncharacterized protein n=1 Tax=Dichotomopilus funicola TaxID=1934379 RepID=A0AAN6VAP3_9PEZI|nr:hypothetical protein C8A04DRAFT_9095 [Dichotomopilus funicola]
MSAHVSFSQGSRLPPTSTEEGPLGTFDILNLPSRVMTPPRRLPLDNSPREAAEQAITNVFGDEFTEKAVEVASRLGLRDSVAWVNLTSRSPATADCMTCIALFKLGFDWLFNNPKTVYISVSHDSDEAGWPPVPPVGNDELANPAVGTLGCWLEIKVRDRGWRTVGLTNYHVIRPCLSGYHIVEAGGGRCSGPVARDTELWKADKEGLGTGAAKQLQVQVESPTRAKLNFSVSVNRAGVEKKRKENPDAFATARISEMEAQEKEWLAFFNDEKHVLGRVCFASGYLQRTSQNGRLDWALINPTKDSRVGQNLLPTSEEWQATWGMGEYPHRTGVAITSPQPGSMTSIHDMKHGDVVYKVGASTKWTIGEFNGFKADCVIKEERYMNGQGRKVPLKSTEFVFIPSLGAYKLGVHNWGVPFARWGDSGSVVWDTNGCAVGLLFRGQSPAQSMNWFTYVTPIEDVFASIKARSGGKIEEIRFLGES